MLFIMVWVLRSLERLAYVIENRHYAVGFTAFSSILYSSFGVLYFFTFISLDSILETIRKLLKKQT